MYDHRSRTYVSVIIHTNVLYPRLLAVAIAKHTFGAVNMHISFAQELVYSVHGLDSTILCVAVLILCGAVLTTKAVPHVAISAVVSKPLDFLDPIGNLDL